jgi:hypothetical protein
LDVTVQQARTIDELYSEVADYDLVLTVDAPLSHALNRRVDQAQLGRFAATPQMLASGEFWPRDDRPLFLKLINQTDFGWKQVAYLLENVLGCWEETGELSAIRNYEQFDTEQIRDVIEVIQSVDSGHSALAEYTVDTDMNVAVIGESLFTELDKQVLPPSYDTISPFTEGSFNLPEFRVFDSSTAIVDTLLDNISPSNADDVAIIMDRGGEYPALVESAFEANGIPFYGGPGFADDDGIRTFLRLLRTAHADSRVRVSDIRPLLNHIGVTASVRDDLKYLHDLDHPAVTDLQEFCESVDDQTFGEALSTFEDWCDSSYDRFHDELERLGLSEQPVTDDALDDLDFYLQSFDIPVDRDDSGVLLADATSAAYVDRPVVFYLGLGVEWTHSIPDRPWIDADAKDRQYLQQFQILLQNGTYQYYLVQETSAGQPVTPCLYFHDLLDEDFETFIDLPHIPHTRLVQDDGTGFDKEEVDAQQGHIETVSQSSLSTFVNCPRDYFFDRLVTNPDRDYFQKGNLYHDYAEFYVNHPDFMQTVSRGEIIDRMVTEMRPYVDDVELEVLETEFEIGLETIERFLDNQPPSERTYERYETQRPDNFFAEYFDKPIDSPVTERWFENPELGGKGKVDLIHSPDQLVDYKSGRQKSASTVVSRSDIETISDKPNFQALLYLAHHRRVQPDSRLEFVFFHFLELVDDAITGELDIDDALVRITYYPMVFEDFVGQREAFDALCEGVAESNNRRKTLERLGYDNYASFFNRHGFPDTDDTDELLESEVATQFTDYAVSEVGDYKYVDKGTEKALKKLARIRGRNYFQDDIDAFEAFLTTQIDRINEYRESRFPVGEPNFDRVTHRDLIRTDD